MIANDEAGQPVADLDMEVEQTVSGELVRHAAGGQAKGERHTQKVPGPRDQVQSPLRQHDGKSKAERTEALEQQVLVTSGTLRLNAGE